MANSRNSNYYIETVDIGIKDLSRAKIALAQLGLPESSTSLSSLPSLPFKDNVLAPLDQNMRFRDEFVTLQMERCFSLLERAKKDRINAIFFPALVTPDNMIPDFIKWAQETHTLIVTGIEPELITQDNTSYQRSGSRVFFPNTVKEEPYIDCSRLYTSKYDHIEVFPASKLYIFKNTGIGSFSVLYDFDYTSLEIISGLQRQPLDLLAVICFNPAIEIYEAYALADCHRNYCYIALVNSGEFGQSGIYAPVRRVGAYHVNRVLRRYRGRGDTLIVSEIDIDSLRKTVASSMAGGAPISGFMTPSEEMIRRKTASEELAPFNIQEVNLGIEDLHPARIALAQIEVPSFMEFTSTRWRFDSITEPVQKNKIRECLGLAEIRNANFVVFPETSIPQSMLEEIETFCKRTGIIFIGGFEYTSDLKNICEIIFPSGQRFSHQKLLRSKYDDPELIPGQKVSIFHNTGYGDFCVLLCMDYTDLSLLSSLQKQRSLDILFVCSYNPAVLQWDFYGKADCHRNFCYIVQVNAANFGGSAVYAPIRRVKGFRVQSVLGKLDGPTHNVMTVDLSCRALRSAREGKPFSELITFMSPPAIGTPKMKEIVPKITKFSHVVFGGTFDVIHKGHHLLIKKAFEIGDYVLIGVTSDESVIHKKLSERILDYTTRKANLEKLLHEEGYTGRFTIVEIFDPFGPAVTEAKLKAIIIGDEEPVRRRTERLNEHRRLNNLDPLEIIVVTYVKADDGRPISSTRIRLGEIETDGRITSQE